MRTLITLSAILGAALTFAQTPQVNSLSPFEQELVGAQNQFVEALEQRNSAYVKQTVADDFRGVALSGDYYDKDELVGVAQEGMPKDFRIYDVRVIRLNDESAVVSYDAITPGGRPRYLHRSDTWAKVSGKWMLKFQQTTRNLWSAADSD